MPVVWAQATEETNRKAKAEALPLELSSRSGTGAMRDGAKVLHVQIVRSAPPCAYIGAAIIHVRGDFLLHPRCRGQGTLPGVCGRD